MSHSHITPEHRSTTRPSPGATAARRDPIEISLARSATPDADGRSAASGAVSRERVAEIRQRIRSGLYDTAAVAGEVARRMLGTAG
jgi:anti-sigma28 factor (negative regulator of flagellin synthesis)